jgi:hypothetical protein
MSEPSTTVLVPLARVDAGNLEQLILMNISCREGRVILRSIWRVDRGGRRMTQSEEIVSEDQLIGRLNKLIAKFWPADVLSSGGCAG